MAAALAGVMSLFVLALQYVVVLPLFALAAKRTARRESAHQRANGTAWTSAAGRPHSLSTQY